MALRDWVKLPTGWIEEGGLRNLRWERGSGANNIAALMSLAVIAHHADKDTGLSRVTYDDLEIATGLSRPKIAAGLNILGNLKVIDREPEGRSTFQLVGYNPDRGWGKLPCKRLYGGDAIVAFSEFKLRQPAELHALKWKTAWKSDPAFGVISVQKGPGLRM